MLWLDIAVVVLCVMALVGTVVPILPGVFLAAGAVLVWAVVAGGTTAWVLGLVVIAITALGLVLKYFIPAKWLKAEGVPTWVLSLGLLGAILGFFLIPIVGLILGFILGIWLAESLRLHSVKSSWPTTVAALKAAGVSSLIDIIAVSLIFLSWLAALVTREQFFGLIPQ